MKTIYGALIVVLVVLILGLIGGDDMEAEIALEKQTAEIMESMKERMAQEERWQRSRSFIE